MKTEPRILLVEDDADWQEIYKRCLSRTNYDIVATRKLTTALTLLAEQPFDVVLTDLKMFIGSEEFHGFRVLEQAKTINPDIQVIVITGYGSADHAMRAMGSGAYDYITKDRELRKKLPLTIQSALEIKRLKQELLGHKPEDDTLLETDRIIGNSATMQTLFEHIAHAAESKTNVLIYGEEGTGKRLIAQTIHRQSKRKQKPFWVIECGGLSESSLETEFYGYAANAHYQGSSRQPGKFERADGGTLFLDGIDSLNTPFQVRLLSLLSESSVTRIGDQEAIPFNVRIIASSTQDITNPVAKGEFRRSLFDILNEISIFVPPLRQRKDGDDILALAAMFLQKHHHGSQVVLSAEVVDLLKRYDYPGNVRELENHIKYALTLCAGGIIKPEHLKNEIRHQKSHQARELPHKVKSQENPLSTSDDKSRSKLNLSKLRNVISDLFNEEELRHMCFDLNVDYQSLAAVGKSGKVRELVDFMRRHDRLEELVAHCRQLRPKGNWINYRC